MKRVILASLLVALVMLIWSTISWVVLPFHMNTINTIPDGNDIAAILAESGIESGLYVYPAEGEHMSQEEMARRTETGPIIAFMVYLNHGMKAMDATMFLRHFLYMFIASLFVGWFLLKNVERYQTFWSRVLVATMFGLFAIFVGPLVDNTWWMFPLGHTFAVALDHVIGWTLAGMVLAWQIKPEIQK